MFLAVTIVQLPSAIAWTPWVYRTTKGCCSACSCKDFHCLPQNQSSDGIRVQSVQTHHIHNTSSQTNQIDHDHRDHCWQFNPFLLLI
jgi:hypothetical protein